MTFFIAASKGFVGAWKPVQNINHAKKFESVDAAEDFAERIGLTDFTVLEEIPFEDEDDD